MARPGEGQATKRMQLTVAPAEIPRTGEGIAFVNGEIGPVVSAMEGNESFVLALDHSAGRYVCWSVWSSPESLAAYADRAVALAVDIVEHLHTGEPTTEASEVLFTHSVKPLHLGNWGQLTRAQMLVDDLDRAVRFLGDTILAWFENQSVPIDIVAGVNRTTGASQALICFETLKALRESEPRLEELRGMLVKAIPGVSFTEISELQVVIAEAKVNPARSRDYSPR